VVVLILERVPPSLKGELSRWLLEIKAGVFVGSISGMVRDRLWEKACASAKGGAGMLVHSSNTEQGFEIRLWGSPSSAVADFEGLWLVHHS
jgi:CRISPR-associated protein Cas2